MTISVTRATSAVGLGAAAARVLNAVATLQDCVTGEGFGWAGDDEVAEALLALTRARRQIEAAAADVAARFSGTTIWSAAGARNPHAWLRHATNEGTVQSGKPFEAGDWMGQHPAMAAAWRDGLITRAHLAVLSDVHAKLPRLSPYLAQLEPQLVEHAVGLDATQFGRTIMRALVSIDPDAVDEADASKRRDKVGLHVSRMLDGYGKVDGLLPPEIGALLITQLDVARDQIRREAAEAAKSASCECGPRRPRCSGRCVTDSIVVCDYETSGSVCTRPECSFTRGIEAARTLPPVAETPRESQTRLSSRNVEALGRILDASASAIGDDRLAGSNGERPVLHIQIETDALVGNPGSAPTWIQSPSGVMFTPITANGAQRISCDALAEVLLVDSRGHLDAISTRWRTTPRGMRRAILLRERGRCRFPGCHTAIREVHHIRHWAHGGPTQTDNLIGLCSHHHHLVHDRKWRIVGDPNTLVTFTDPTGRAWSS